MTDTVGVGDSEGDCGPDRVKGMEPVAHTEPVGEALVVACAVPLTVELGEASGVQDGEPVGESDATMVGLVEREGEMEEDSVSEAVALGEGVPVPPVVAVTQPVLDAVVLGVTEPVRTADPVVVVLPVKEEVLVALNAERVTTMVRVWVMVGEGDTEGDRLSELTGEAERV